MELTEAQQLQNAVQSDVSILLGEYGWLLLAALVVLFFKTTIETLIAGLVVFVGNDYNNDDIIILDGRPGRIVRVSMWKTTFYLYNIKTGADGKKFVSGGTKMSVENDKLKDLKIEKPMESVDVERLDLVYAGESTPTKVY
jgi:hypothetical protein|tara:strand:- start:549 stop:971 length:423 start_codon:yes stop_codon:yes gene_type:complete